MHARIAFASPNQHSQAEAAGVTFVRCTCAALQA